MLVWMYVGEICAMNKCLSQYFGKLVYSFISSAFMILVQSPKDQLDCNEIMTDENI